MLARTIAVDFTRFGTGAWFVAGGWNQAERDGTWSQGRVSRLRFPKPPGATRFACEMLFRTYTEPGGPVEQRIGIEVDGQRVHAAVTSGVSRIGFGFAAEALAGRPDIEICIRLPDAVAPASLGRGNDIRELAICLRDVTLSWEGDGLELGAAAAPPRTPKVAAVTMVYNEPEFLPIWLRHYARHVGAAHCYVVDHGSTDGSTEDLQGANRIRIPRSPYDPQQQSEWNSEFASSLLRWYDYVIYSDVDEILLPDPAVAPTLVEYCRRPLPPVVNAIGLNTIHVMDAEPKLDLTRPVTEQRRYAFFCSPACKPLLIRRKVVWSPGSHSADAPVAFDHLYNFHLRWFDLPLGLERLHRTRTMSWAPTDAGAHARVADEEFARSYAGFAALQKRDDMAFDPVQAPMSDWLDKVVASQAGRENDTYRISLDIWPDSLWRLPDRFVGSF